MNLYQLLGTIEDMSQFRTIYDFSNFTKNFLEFIHNNGMQAEIISRNEPNYHFYQYRQEGYFCITRPINTDLFLPFESFDDATEKFYYSLEHIKDIETDGELRNNLNKYIYTCQQCIGSTLDAFNNPNKARKRNHAARRRQKNTPPPRIKAQSKKVHFLCGRNLVFCSCPYHNGIQ